MKHNLLKLCALLFLILGLTSLYAQDAIPASGGNATGSGGSTSYSVGQAVYTINSGTSGSVAHGVQQPYEISDWRVGNEEAKGISLMVSVYPNPASDYLTLKADDVDLSTLYFKLFDMNGRLLQSKKITSNETIIDMINLRPATYLLTIIKSDTEVKTFKIIKN